MIIAAFVSYAHFLAFFAITTALVLQLTLISESISVEIAKRIQRADLAYGIFALLLPITILIIFSFCSNLACLYWLV
jgi:uncharacterized membrane protein